MANYLKIRRKKGKGRIIAWTDDGMFYIRESVDRGRDVQTISVSEKELRKVLELEFEGKIKI